MVQHYYTVFITFVSFLEFFRQYTKQKIILNYVLQGSSLHKRININLSLSYFDEILEDFFCILNFINLSWNSEACRYLSKELLIALPLPAVASVLKHG